MPIDHKKILRDASCTLSGLQGFSLGGVTVNRPSSDEEALHLSKTISKLSPLVSNLIEYKIVAYLNEMRVSGGGQWVRQDPGFPDALFRCESGVQPGIEIKTWFPLATEITARFKDSVSHFSHRQTNVVMVAWLPSNLIYGQPRVLDIWVEDAWKVARARDSHYSNPPDYIVLEPEDTSKRTANLQQTNVNGYKFQGSPALLEGARKYCRELSIDKSKYSVSSKYQKAMRALFGKYRYRLDTNFAKMDRIQLSSLESFKTRVMGAKLHDKPVQEWAVLFSGKDPADLKRSLRSLLGQSHSR